MNPYHNSLMYTLCVAGAQDPMAGEGGGVHILAGLCYPAVGAYTMGVAQWHGTTAV